METAAVRALAGLASAFGDGTVRLTPDQNIFLRWVPVDLLPQLETLPPLEP